VAEGFRDISYPFQANSKLILKLEHYCFYSVLPCLLFASNSNINGYCVSYSIVKIHYNNAFRYIKKLIHSTTFVTLYIPVEILTVYTTYFYITIISYFYFSFTILQRLIILNSTAALIMKNLYIHIYIYI
jgi:hypothetical protein